MISPNIILLALCLATSAVEAFWRMECFGMAGLARIDPLISPGVASQHVHALFGSSNLGLSSTPEDLRRGSCTSCAVAEDKSGYWQPALYFEHENGTVEYVGIVGDTGMGNAGILAYYKLLNDNGGQESGVTAFPEGFRMIAGSATARTLPAGIVNYMPPDPPKSNWHNLGQDILTWRAIGFNCLHTAGDGHAPEPSLYRHYMPSVAEVTEWECTSGLRTEIVFPSCWNGEEYNSENPQAHVRYPSLSEDGQCPPGFKIRLPTLMYEAIWDVMKFVGVNGRFVLSNGDTTGFGMHADFMNGWDQPTLEAAVAHCHSPSGQISECNVFTIQQKEDWESCKLTLPNELAGEAVRSATFSSLPGGPHITQPGDEGTDPLVINAMPNNKPVPSSSESSAAETVEPSESSAAETMEPSTEAIEPVVAPTTTLSQAVSNEPIETEPPLGPDESVSYSVISTEYRTEGNKVYEIVWEEAWVFVTEEVTSTVTVSTGPNPIRRGRERRGHSHKHHEMHRRY